MNQKDRIEWIDAVKGITIILVVLGHSISGSGVMESKIENAALIWKIIYRIITSFHMPIFFFVSGYLYDRHNDECEFSIEKYKSLIHNKFCDCIIPYVIFELLYVAFGIVTNDQRYTVDAFLRSIYSPISHFWFLYVLFFIYLIIPMVLYAIKKESLAILSFGIFTVYICDILKYNGAFPLDRILYYSLFFLIGKYSSKAKISLALTTPIKGGIIFVYLTLLVLEYKLSIGKIVLVKLLAACVAIYGVIGIFNARRKFTFLEVIGKNTMPVYLIHSLFVSSFRSILGKLGMHNYSVIIIITCAAGVVCPFMIGLYSRKNIIINRLFYPRKYLKE